MDEPTTPQLTSPLRASLTGLAGFTLASLVGILATWLLFKTGLIRLPLALVPEGQPLVRLLLGLFLVFLGAGLGGAVGGLVRGYTLQRIDPGGSRRRYLLGGAFASGISQGILLVPVLLLLALVGKYNPASPKEPTAFLALFSLIGAVFGLLSGLILGLITLRLRYFWLAWLASILGGALGGALFGLALWRQAEVLGQDTQLLQSLVFFAILAVAFGLSGGVLGLAYRWVAQRRERTPGRSVEPARWQDILVIALGALLSIAAISLTNTLVNFVTVQTGTTTTSLSLETEGVQWYATQPLTANIAEAGTYPPALGALPEGYVALAWVVEQDGNGEVVYATKQSPVGDGILAWSDPQNVSLSPENDSTGPQLAQDFDGDIHIVWTEQAGEGSEIRYSHCMAGTCSTPVALSAAGGEDCSATTTSVNVSPGIALNPNGEVIVVWNAGDILAFRSWQTGSPPDSGKSACLQPGSRVDPDLTPRLTWIEPGTFVVVYSAAEPSGAGDIETVQISHGVWGEPSTIAQGSLAEVYRDNGGSLHYAWCGANNALGYVGPDGAVGEIEFPPCRSRPAFTQDSQGRVHLLWYSDMVQDNFNQQHPQHLLYESIRLESGWSQPAIVARTASKTMPATASVQGGEMLLAWGEAGAGAPSLQLASQAPYQCSQDTLTTAGQAVLEVVQSGEFHPAGYQSPFCQNQYETFIHMPNPNPAYSNAPPTPNGGFDRLSLLVQEANYELLFSNMQWDPDEGGLSPGYRIVEGIAQLYQRVKADPVAYPRGMTVRILLGNYPNLATFTYGDQIWNVINDLRQAGVEMQDPEIGWKVEVANFRGQYPHSHTKFIVIDGESLLSAGFNISWLHLPDEQASGKGSDLTDLGMLVQGPVAQAGMAAFDDQWSGAEQMTCSDLQIGEEGDRWKNSCEWQTATVSHVPEVLRYSLAEQDQTAFALYRTDVYKEADQAYNAALASAKQSIELIHVNFSAEIVCWLDLAMPGFCTFDENALSWMKSMVDAIEQNHVQVRVIVENANSNGAENRIALQLLQGELERRGLSEYFEMRFFNGRVHTKSALIDEQLLFVGSQNFHYSSFGPGGLLEFVVATESPQAIQAYQDMFEYYWELAIPADEAVWGATGSE